MEVILYQPVYQHHFERLNKAWIEQYFELEPLDRFVLENPEEAILNDGGCILFARENGRIIGTVALKRINPTTFELTKMAVDESFRGMGAGKVLCNAAIEKARTLHAERLILYSNQNFNKTAVQLYRKLGFKEIPLERGRYVRADIMMEHPLEGISPLPEASHSIAARHPAV